MPVPLHVIHLDQDDPKKCTSKRLQAYNLVSLHTKPEKAPRRGFLLDPSSNMVLSPLDKRLMEIGGSIVVLDCSWKRIDESIEIIQSKSRLDGRVLPHLLAANQVSWGKIGRLSSVEALAASLMILGWSEQAKQILGPFPFGEHFLELNHQPLEAYSNAKSIEEVLSLQDEFFE